ncbi:MAG TPA: DegT/DnrJ/EryC1/StrS family aminotransferase [Bryobacteraceae bacterium]|nr:DegT/DnrJ/EryC1/StrS family aminotransferase [Bryobacteraceae bacterium]
MRLSAIAGGTPVRSRPFPLWPEFDQRELDALRRVIESRSWGGYSPAVSELERRFAELHQVPYAVACSNGTVALEAALVAAGIGSGDEVIVPPISFIATAAAPALAGGIPVFADIDPDTQNLDPRAFEAAITRYTRAAIVVHFAGHPADMDRICEIAEARGIALIEDAAHAHGAAWRGRPVGGFGLASTFSFQDFKLMTGGEGGMVLTGDPEMAAKVRSVCNQGRRAGGQWYEHVNLGTNYRLTGLQAAVLLAQMERLGEHNRRRAANVARLRASLGPGLEPLAQDPRVTVDTHYLIVLRYRPEAFEGLPREAFLAAVRAEGIPISPGYPYPLYRNPLFTGRALHARSCPAACEICARGIDYSRLSLDAAEQACRESVWLEHALFLGTESDVDDILEAFEKVRAGAGQVRALWEAGHAHA